MNIETALEFNKIKEMWSELAFTEQAKKQISETKPVMAQGELKAKIRETSEARILLDKAGNPPLVSLGGMHDILLAAGKGDCLTAGDLEEVEKALVAVTRLKDYLNRCKQYEVPLAFYEENLDALTDLKEMIHEQIRNGGVDDNASKLLKNVRMKLEQTKDHMREKADSVMRANKDCMSDNFSTFRNGRLCIPVKKEYKFRINGSVIDKSATGNTLFIEPTAVARFYEELQLLLIEEENEERRILYILTVEVSEHQEAFEQNIRTIEKLDYIFSKGKLSMELNATAPEITLERKIRLCDGRHPLLDPEICVPLQFEIGNGTRGIVITGPNTGGKTVAIKTVALCCYMAQCGLHVTAKQAVICMNSSILCDIGDGQNLAENLSTFSAHIMNVLEILRQVSADSLVIMDELGSGTDPTEGMGIAVSILEELRKSGALFLVTTHYPEVKTYAEREPDIVNARMTFDKESLRPLYQMIIGEAGESCAFYIAQRMGMPDEMLKTAVKAAYGEHAPQGLILKQTDNEIKKEHAHHIQKERHATGQQKKESSYTRGDSVMVFPEKKIGIVCTPTDERGMLQVQLPDGKRWISHKRVKLHVAASQLYPEDYDFSIVFDSVETRKKRHQMERKYTKGDILVTDEE